ncbi:MAG: efflux RND transporter periplasmic adaptor subunit [Gammaproteobacteria bacterium]
MNIRIPHFFRLPALPALALLCACTGAGDALPPAPPPDVSVAQVLAREVAETEEFTGRTDAVDTVEIRSRVRGVVEKVAFQAGATVQAGAPLFTIDPRPFQAAVSAARAAVAGADARVVLARSQADRAERLVRNRTVSEEELERRRAEARVAEAELLAARARLEQAELDLSFTDIRAPIRGRVTRHYVSPGNFIEGGTNNATLLAVLVSIEPVYVYFDVPERALAGYRAAAARYSAQGQALPVRIELAGGNGFSIAGEVDYTEPRVDPGTGTAQMRAVVREGAADVAPGVFARVRLASRAPYTGVLVSERAVQFDQGQTFVYVVGPDARAQYRKVDLGPPFAGLRIVRNGLSEKERVVVNGLQRVRAGIEVKPQLVPMPDDAGTAAPAIIARPAAASAPERPPAS